MTNSAVGSIFKRKDGKYFIYIPVKLAEDSLFPFPLGNKKSVKVKITYDINAEYLKVEKHVS